MTVSRRSVVQGTAWSVPAVTLAAASPAMAASSPACSAASRAAIDAALDTTKNQGSLTINFYQAVQSANGYLGESWANLRNDSNQTLVYTNANPLTLRVDVIALSGDNRERDMTKPSTSWGAITDQGFNATTKIHTYVWTFVGTIPGKGQGDNEADMWFHWQDGNLFGRKTNAVGITPLTTNPPSAPPLSSITLASGQAVSCQAYYDQKVLQYNSTVKDTIFFADGSKNSGSSDRYGDQSVKIGQTVRSDEIGDFRPAGAGDGIY